MISSIVTNVRHPELNIESPPMLDPDEPEITDPKQIFAAHGVQSLCVESNHSVTKDALPPAAL